MGVSQKQAQDAEKEVARLSGQVSTLEISLAKTSVSPKTKRDARSTRSSMAAKPKKPK